MGFGDTLRELLQRRGITQKEFAEAFHMAPSTVGSYVQGVREPDFDTLVRIATYFDVSTDYLLGRYGNSPDRLPENRLLGIFRSLTPAQKEVFIQQGEALTELNRKK